MALWDGPYVLGQFNRLAGRPQADQISDPTKYIWLSEAQNQVIGEIAARQPEILFPIGALPMTTTDGGQTFTFGIDPNTGGDLFPMGKVMIYPSLQAVPDFPWVPGYDYMENGTRIEIPNNGTYAGTLYWRGIGPWPDISATVPPTLQPPAAREMITFLAVKNFAQAGNINPDLAAQMTDLWQRAFQRWMLVYRTQFTTGGGMGPLVSNPIYGPYSYATYLPATSAL